MVNLHIQLFLRKNLLSLHSDIDDLFQENSILNNNKHNGDVVRLK